MRPATIFASPRWQRSSPALLAGPRSRSLAGSRSPSCQEWVNLGATVVSPFTMRLSAALLPAGLLLAACATFNANVQTKKDLNQLKHIFVQQSGNDNHGLDTLIVRQLQDRGIQAESGPLTLMPRDAKAYLTYEDRWDWDFKTYLIALTLSLRDVRNDELLATASEFRPAAFLSKPAVMVQTVLDGLFKALAGQGSGAPARPLTEETQKRRER